MDMREMYRMAMGLPKPEAGKMRLTMDSRGKFWKHMVMDNEWMTSPVNYKIGPYDTVSEAAHATGVVRVERSGGIPRVVR